MTAIEKLLEDVKDRVVPTDEEKERMLEKVSSLRARLESAFSSRPVEVHEQGSIAKDTWLRQETDVDIFVEFPPEYSKEEIASVTISTAKKLFGERRCTERYAEHPFVTAHVEDLSIDIVPCFKSRMGKWRSATDRTPYHTKFVRSQLSQEEKDQARLIKQFAKGIHVYGAEIRVGGFSGILCELLAHHFKSFEKMVETMSSLRLPFMIDPMKYYQGREDEAYNRFGSGFVVVDPVDERRNVAAAVTQSKLSEMIVASVAFLKDPNIKFFFPGRKTLTRHQLGRTIVRERRQLLAIQFGKIRAPPDVLWGQLYSARDKVLTIMRNADFNVTRIAAWTDEKTCSLIVLELESRTLPRFKLKRGPPVNSIHTQRYLDLYAGGGASVGPWIQGDRLYTMARRKYVDADTYLQKALKEAKGMPSLIAEKLRAGIRILVDDNIQRLAKSREVATFLTEFIDGRPVWMRSVYGNTIPKGREKVH